MLLATAIITKEKRSSILLFFFCDRIDLTESISTIIGFEFCLTFNGLIALSSLFIQKSW